MGIESDYDKIKEKIINDYIEAIENLLSNISRKINE